MGMPWTLDALKPAPERYASLRFRRFAQNFDPYRAQFAEAAELAALIHVIGDTRARYVFHWSPATLRERVRPLIAHPPIVEAAKPMIEDNLRHMDVGDGLGLFAAMQDGGWKGGPACDLMRMTVMALRDEGKTWEEVAQVLRISVDQARVLGDATRARQIGANNARMKALRKGDGGDEAVGTSWLVG